MSIADVTARLTAARDAQAAALAAKGVEVPDGAGFETFPALIESISTGTETESGTFTLDANSIAITIPTSKKCSFVSVWYPLTEEIPGPFSAYKTVSCVAIEGAWCVSVYINYNETGLASACALERSYDARYNYVYFRETEIELACRPSGSGTQAFLAGIEYQWLAW